MFIRYEDQPGVIGRVGSMFGGAGVNIANMAVSRTKEGGEALMVFSIDTTATDELVDQLHDMGPGLDESLSDCASDAAATARHKHILAGNAK